MPDIPDDVLKDFTDQYNAFAAQLKPLTWSANTALSEYLHSNPNPNPEAAAPLQQAFAKLIGLTPPELPWVM